MDAAKIKDWHAHVYFDAITIEPAQAAAIVGISSEAFRQRLARARGKLRERLLANENRGARHP